MELQSIVVCLNSIVQMLLGLVADPANTESLFSLFQLPKVAYWSVQELGRDGVEQSRGGSMTSGWLKPLRTYILRSFRSSDPSFPNV